LLSNIKTTKPFLLDKFSLCSLILATQVGGRFGNGYFSFLLYSRHTAGVDMKH